MFDIGMAEMLVIGVVALIVVGPKDLPMMFRKVGNFVGRARGMARDFQRAMDSAADEAGVNDIKSSFDEATDMSDMTNLGLDDIPPASKSFGAQYDDVADKMTGNEAKTPATQKPATKKAAAKKPATKKPSPKSGAKPGAKKPASKTAAKPKAKS